MTLDFNDSIPTGDTSNFRYMVTKVPFEAGDYLIFRLKVDRWVDPSRCNYLTSLPGETSTSATITFSHSRAPVNACAQFHGYIAYKLLAF